jgi:ribonuclease D
MLVFVMTKRCEKMGEFHIFDNDLDQSTLETYLECEAIAVDTETMGLIPRRDRLCLVQICDHQDRVSIIRIARGVKQAPLLKILLEAESVVKVFHFARFDVGILEAHLSIATYPIFCTKIASKLARTYTDKHGLKELVKELEKVELNKEAQSSDWGDVYNLSEEQLQYASNDVRYLLPVRQKLIQMLIREGRLDLAKACFAHIPTQVYLDLLGYGDVFAH